MNIAIHGEKELLIQLAKDISHVHEVGRLDVEDVAILMVYVGINCAELYPHTGIGVDKRLCLTATNYTEILNKIIEKK